MSRYFGIRRTRGSAPLPPAEVRRAIYAYQEMMRDGEKHNERSTGTARDTARDTARQTSGDATSETTGENDAPDTRGADGSNRREA